MASADKPSTLTMTTESGHRLYMVYSTKSCPELQDQINELIESHGDAHEMTDADAAFSVRIDYDREHQKAPTRKTGKTSDTAVDTDESASQGVTFRPSKDRAIASMSDKLYGLLVAEGYADNNKVRDLRVVPFRYHKSHTPSKDYTFSIFIQLPLSDLPIGECQSQLSAFLQSMETYGWVTSKQYNIVYPTFSRESGKSRGTALIFFDRSVSKDNIIKARLILDHAKFYLPVDHSADPEEHYVNIRSMWALLSAVRKQFGTRTKAPAKPVVKPAVATTATKPSVKVAPVAKVSPPVVDVSTTVKPPVVTATAPVTHNSNNNGPKGLKKLVKSHADNLEPSSTE
jgi:hypothetical protein